MRLEGNESIFLVSSDVAVLLYLSFILFALLGGLFISRWPNLM